MESSNTSELRSSSLPSRLNPSCSRIEISLNKLKKLVPLYSSTHIHSGLVCLIDLYVSVDELIGSSRTQNVNLQYRNKALVEDALDRSTRLMDSYSNLVELLAQMKENVRALQFALRRKGISTYASIEGHLLDYILSRKKAKKNIVGCLASLEQLERETESYLVAGGDHHLSSVIGVLREVFIATISVFRYILVTLSSKPKLDKGFSLILKLITTSKSSCHKSQEIDNDADIIDLTLDSLSKNIKKNECKSDEVQMVTERLHKVDCQIEGYEVGLDSLFRKLIQTRVSLLNILAN
ncbi:hypothetical protein L1987_68451 [Smallanthus sonchifolius]|uniref:Uncharacterized protein n=1 Tax=Smallanthus sonchifolius TaxID=185202 RepID=A0ACB9B401_9ASTR|nr:hypothetical protein L1987_68451 [Smallanthus sonchifolius]